MATAIGSSAGKVVSVAVAISVGTVATGVQLAITHGSTVGVSGVRVIEPVIVPVGVSSGGTVSVGGITIVGGVAQGSGV